MTDAKTPSAFTAAELENHRAQIAAMSDADLDAELRAFGIDPSTEDDLESAEPDSTLRLFVADECLEYTAPYRQPNETDADYAESCRLSERLHAIALRQRAADHG